MIYAVLIIAAVALGLAAFALYVAIAARSRAIDAESRVARHQREHRLGAEEDGLRRHRADPTPRTEQIAAQRPSGSTRAEPEGVDLEEHPTTGLISAAEPPPAGPYAQLRRNAEQRADTGDLPATAAHAAPRRPGSAPNFTAPPPARPSLPPPGRIDRDR